LVASALFVNVFILYFILVNVLLFSNKQITYLLKFKEFCEILPEIPNHECLRISFW